MTLRRFLTVLMRRKWIVLVVVAAAVVVTLRVALRATPLYESYSKLLVSRGQQTTAFNSNVKMLSWEEELTSELEAIRSAAVYQRAQQLVTESGLKGPGGEPYMIDPTMVLANVPGKSSVIHILYRSPDRQIVAEVVKALTQSYQEFRVATREQDPTDFLNAEITDIETQTQAWESRRSDFLTQVGSVELPQERAQLLSAKRMLETDLAVARSDVAEREARVLWLQGMLQGENGAGGAAAYTFNDPNERGESVIVTLRKMILTVKSEYFALRGEFTDSHPRVLALRERLDELEKTLGDEAQAYLGYLSAQVEATWAKVASLQASLDYLDEQLRSFPDREAQLSRMDRMLADLRTTQDALVARRADALTTRLGASLVDVVILELAVEPYAVHTVDNVRLAIIPIFALLVAIGFAFLADSLDPSFRDREELETQLRLPVLGEVRNFR
jgi:uncharacterized protein involved in exopolysaccharide biosynthesis